MDLFELKATLGLDSSAYTSGLKAAEKLATSFAKSVYGFGKDVIETGMGFEKQMSAVQAVLGETEGTMEHMETLRTFAMKQARDSIFTSEETAKAYYYMGMAGWKTQEMLDGLPGIMALAAASGEDLSMVSDIVTDSLTAFGWGAGRASEFADILAQAATNSNTDVRRMGQTFKYVAPIAGSLGVEVQDVALSIGLLASQGIKGSMAGTALRSILTRISTNAGETKKDLGALTIVQDKLGVSVWDTSGKMRDFGDIIKESRVAWKGLTEEQQVYYAKQIGSLRGMAAWLALMNATEEDVEQLENAFANAEGAAQNMADVKLDNLWGDIEMFYSSLDVLENTIYEDVKGPLRDVVQFGASALDRITDAINENGLTGGIEQLGKEIETAGEMLAPMLESLGTALAPLLDGLMNTLMPKIEEAGAKLAAGLLKGLGEGFTKNGNILGLLFSSAGYGIQGVTDLFDWLGLFSSGNSTGGDQYAALYQTPDMGGYTPLPYGADMYGDVPVSADTSSIPDEINSAIEGTDADPVPVDADTSSMPGDITSAVESVGTLEVPVVASFQGFAGFISGLFGGGGGHFAKATYGGRILHGATVFGMDSKGGPLVGGESSPEAVVGVGSLHQMINDSVSGAFSGMLDRLDGMIDRMPGGNMRVVLDTGALVGGLVSEMDMSLNDRAVWKGYGRTL